MFTALAAAVALAAPVPKNLAAELKWRFAKGDTFYVRTETDATTSLNLGGAPQEAVMAAVYVCKVTVTAADQKGITLEMEFTSCKASAGVGPAKLADEPAVVGKVVKLTLDNDHKVTKAEGAGQLAQGAAAGVLQEEVLRHNVEDLLRAVPGKALAKGDKWTGEESSRLSKDATLKRADRGVVAGTEDGLVKLEVESDQEMTATNVGGTGMNYSLKGEKGKRTVLFDPKGGRVRKVEEKYTLSGTVDAGGQNLKLTSTVNATLTVSDTEPTDEK